MIKIIKSGTRHFSIICSTCETTYSYDLHDLQEPITNTSATKCPCCGMMNYHYQRNATPSCVEAISNTEMLEALEDEICAICKESTKCDGDTCIMSYRVADGLVKSGWRKDI